MATVVNLYLDHPKFGCGERQYVAILGRKLARLVMISTGEHTKIPLADFHGAVRGTPPARAKEFAPTRVSKRLRRNAKTYGNEKSVAVKEALAALRVSA